MSEPTPKKRYSSEIIVRQTLEEHDAEIAKVYARGYRAGMERAGHIALNEFCCVCLNDPACEGHHEAGCAVYHAEEIYKAIVRGMYQAEAGKEGGA